MLALKLLNIAFLTEVTVHYTYLLGLLVFLSSCTVYHGGVKDVTLLKDGGMALEKCDLKVYRAFYDEGSYPYQLDVPTSTFQQELIRAELHRDLRICAYL